MVIKTAVIPSMNSSWARTQRGKAKDGQIGRERQRETDRQGNRGRERGEGGERLMLGPWGSLAQSAGHASERMC